MGRTNRSETVLEFYRLFYNEKRFEEGAALLHEGFVNHHRGATGAGRRGMVEDFRRAARGLPDFHIEARRTAEDGEFVWVHALVTGLPGGKLAVNVDIWRFEDGKLAEHWDVSQAIAPQEAATAI